jgi:glyoxylase-like metal-dependent hydrolase (beta-lactamase superfamily II)
MQASICTACGTQYPPSEHPAETCAICQDERQFVPVGGQGWTTLERLRISHFNAYREHEPHLIGIGTQPVFAIGQRALLILTPAGNVLWDCISLLDAATITLVKALGGLKAIAISHPHFYTTMADWAQAFDAPVYLHAKDRKWIMRPHARLQFWDGPTHALAPGITLIRCGGHFPGGSALHWADGAGGRGALMSADMATVNMDRKSFTFMRSYPNAIPLSEKGARAIGAALAPFPFDRVYSHFFERVIPADAKRILQASIDRYVAAIGGAYDRG